MPTPHIHLTTMTTRSRAPACLLACVCPSYEPDAVRTGMNIQCVRMGMRARHGRVCVVTNMYIYAKVCIGVPLHDSAKSGVLEF